jgi:hypothetical protein
MADNLDILNTSVSLLIKAALLAARFSGRVRQRSLKRLAGRDTDAKAKEILFLKDRVEHVRTARPLPPRSHEPSLWPESVRRISPLRSGPTAA